MAYEFMHATAPKFHDGSGYPEHPVDMLNRLSQEGWDLVQSFSIESHLLCRQVKPAVDPRPKFPEKPQRWTPGTHINYGSAADDDSLF